MSGSGRWLVRVLRGCAAITLGGVLLTGCERTISDEGFETVGGEEPGPTPTDPPDPTPTEGPGS